MLVTLRAEQDGYFRIERGIGACGINTQVLCLLLHRPRLSALFLSVCPSRCILQT